MAVLGTQAVATCIAIFGLGLVTPLDWYWALLVWGYALAWALVNDRVKLLTYWVLDSVKAANKPEAKSLPKLAADAKAPPEPEAEPRPDAAKPQPEAKADTKPDGAKSQPEAKAGPKPDDAKPQPETETRPGATQPRAKSDVTTLLHRSLGDLLVAGLEKDPEDAGRIIAAAITQAVTPAAATLDAKAAPKAETEAERRPKETPQATK